MMRRCACVIVAMASFPLNGGTGQPPIGASYRGNDTDHASPNTDQHPAAPKNPRPRQPPPGGNPLWGIPITVARFLPSVSDRFSPRPSARQPYRSNLRSHSEEPRSASRKMSRSFLTKQRKTRSSPCRRSGFWLVFAFGRFADNDA
jgi:hypothetical protein